MVCWGAEVAVVVEAWPTAVAEATEAVAMADVAATAVVVAGAVGGGGGGGVATAAMVTAARAAVLSMFTNKQPPQEVGAC